MIHNDIQNQLQLLVKTSAPPLVAVADHALETPQWTPGQQIPAHVLASLPNGRFQVRVGDQVLDLNLPPNTHPGDSVELTYVTNSPRLTFALVRDLPASAPANTNTPVALSDTAKFIGNLLQNAVPALSSRSGNAQTATQPPVGDQAGTVQTRGVQTTPVLMTAPADTTVFAQALRTSVSQSGLFYEAHQVQWLSGELSLASLKQEPQGRLPVAAQSQSQVPTHLSVNSGAPQAIPSMTPNASVPVATQLETSNPATQGNAASANNLGTGAMANGVHADAVPLVQQQLQTLDTRQVVWQGQVWPGQQMHWSIEEEMARRGGGQGNESPTWHTHLNLQMPGLGGVSAKLAFVNGQVQLDISADSGDSVSRMRQHQTELVDRFASSGLQLSGVTIQHG